MPLLKTVLRGAVVAGVVAAALLANQLKEQREVGFGLSADGKSIVFNAADAGGNGLYTLDLLTSKVHRVTRSPVSEVTPSFSPDGRRIVYAATPVSSPAAHLYTVSLAGEARKQLTTNPHAYDDLAAFSAGGTQIVFARALLRRPYSMGGWTWDKWDIYAMRADGTGLRRLSAQGYAQANSPKFTPDGRAVVFSADTVDPNTYTSYTNVYRVGLTGNAPPRPLTSNGHSSSPVFAPDGKHILYISDAAVPFQYEVWSMNPDGTHPTQITHEHCYLMDPAVTPDGKHILALAKRGELIRYDLDGFDRDGTHPRRLADSTLFDDPMHWKPH